ncbi:hypothetical protein ACQKPE_00670 [Pseudomonas sp. NPDC089554]|uniref:hypothetical protein n=1 Tax=Pseudomonas sp. NPDC089554 TaxID=3390653 RepID=UPI003CFC558C
MIRLDLGDEPETLKASREERLPAAITAFNNHGTGHEDFTKLLDTGYQVARPDLRDRQHGKCAFCEKNEDPFKRPVEHFRPKKGAEDKVDGRWVGINTHYWWMAWTWSNLYFACDRCNMNGRKGSRFPIEAGYERISTPCRPSADEIAQEHYVTHHERRLLIDPRHDNPFEHLQWMPVDRTKPKGSWKWTVEGRDERGEMTVEVLCLSERVDEVNRHLNGLQLLWRQLHKHVQAGRLDDAREGWDELLDNYVDTPAQPFRNAAWWAADSLFPAQEREELGLRHPAIPEVRQQSASTTGQGQ